MLHKGKFIFQLSTEASNSLSELLSYRREESWHVFKSDICALASFWEQNQLSCMTKWCKSLRICYLWNMQKHFFVIVCLDLDLIWLDFSSTRQCNGVTCLHLIRTCCRNYVKLLKVHFFWCWHSSSTSLCPSVFFCSFLCIFFFWLL